MCFGLAEDKHFVSGVGEVVKWPWRIIGRPQVRDDVDEAFDWPLCAQTSSGRRRQVLFELGVLGGMNEQAMINQEAQEHASSCPCFARLLGQLAPAFMRLPVRHQHLDEPPPRMALDHIERAPGQVRCHQITRGLCARILAGPDPPLRVVGADGQPRPANHHLHRATAAEAEALRRTGRGRNIVRDVLCALMQAAFLMATELGDDLHPTTPRRGAVDQGCRAIAGIRRETVPLAGGMVRRALCSQAQSQGLLGWRGRIRRRVRRPLLGGHAWLREGLRRCIPGAQLGGRLREAKAYREGDGRCDHEEEEPTWPPAIATACLVAALVQMGERVS